MIAARGTAPTSCPSCRSGLDRRDGGCDCAGCGRPFDDLDGVPDLRLRGDRYLDREADRAKAARLSVLSRSMDIEALAHAYYAMTADIDAPRRARYLAHLDRAEARGEALSRLLPADGSILEVGCGTGGLLLAASRAGRTITGVDIAARWLVVARRRLEGSGVPILAADAARLPWGSGDFDAVAADSVVEHLDDPAASLAEWARVVRPGGRLVLWSPNRFSIAPDPHVGLLGVGWLPTRWATRYVRARTGRAWDARPLSSGAASRLANNTGWVDVRISAPTVPTSWARSREVVGALLAYNTLNRSRLGGWICRSIGPLWQLTARRGAA